MIYARSILVIVLSFCCLAASDDRDTRPAVVPDHEILEELKSAPKENRDRVQRIRELYVQAGAAEDEVRLQEVKLGNRDETLQHNVIATKRGETDSVIVVGGHLDKVPPGDGVIDDWSGACLATNLYQTLLPVKTHHTFVFIGFAHEEHGLVGSRAYVESLSEDERKRIKAMVNLEVLGVDDPFIWSNGSTDSLEVVAHRVAREHKLPLRDHVIVGVGADSMSFGKVGIPNITFDGLPLDKIRLIHSDQDTYANINPEAYLNAYRFTSRFLVTLDRDLAARPDLLTEPDPKAAAKRVDEYVEAEMKRRHIPGLSVAVARNGELLVAKGFGMANLELSVAATADSVYQIGSIVTVRRIAFLPGMLTWDSISILTRSPGGQHGSAWSPPSTAGADQAAKNSQAVWRRRIRNRPGAGRRRIRTRPAVWRRRIRTRPRAGPAGVRTRATHGRAAPGVVLRISPRSRSAPRARHGR